ncbi:MAG: hypothetical protein MJ237_06195 [bacterium]|nr:hypothetical protein [bacterium]
MSYKTGAEYIQVYQEPIGGYQGNDEIVVSALEHVSDTRSYKIIQNGKVIFEFCEDDYASGQTSIIDALYSLKYENNSVFPIKDDLPRQDCDKLFINGEMPEMFKEITSKPTKNWWKNFKEPKIIITEIKP